MEKEIFKVEDKVFHYGFGWGKIDFIDDEQNDYPDYPILVIFKSGLEHTFTLDGKFELTDINPTLSFTEYTLEGFSQERPIVLPEVGELCLVRDSDRETWMTVQFKKYDKTKPSQFIDSNNKCWNQLKRIKILD
jgi:hypothetical protein